MDWDEIIRRIWTALPAQAILPMRNVTFADGSAPEANRCKLDVLKSRQRAGSWLARERQIDAAEALVCEGPKRVTLQHHAA
jgi:hypothetical protein